MSDLPPGVTTVDLYIGDHFYCRMSREVYEEELRIAREVRPAIDQLRAWADKALFDEAATIILAATGADVAPQVPVPETEAQRVQRELVPLVRAAGGAT